MGSRAFGLISRGARGAGRALCPGELLRAVDALRTFGEQMAAVENPYPGCMSNEQIDDRIAA